MAAYVLQRVEASPLHGQGLERVHRPLGVEAVNHHLVLREVSDESQLHLGEVAGEDAVPRPGFDGLPQVDAQIELGRGEQLVGARARLRLRQQFLVDLRLLEALQVGGVHANATRLGRGVEEVGPDPQELGFARALEQREAPHLVDCLHALGELAPRDDELREGDHLLVLVEQPEERVPPRVVRDFQMVLPEDGRQRALALVGRIEAELHCAPLREARGFGGHDLALLDDPIPCGLQLPVVQLVWVHRRPRHLHAGQNVGHAHFLHHEDLPEFDALQNFPETLASREAEEDASVGQLDRALVP